MEVDINVILDMTPNISACCVTTLRARQQTADSHCNQYADREANDVAVSKNQDRNKYCTVVENGRVVIKAVES